MGKKNKKQNKPAESPQPQLQPQPQSSARERYTPEEFAEFLSNNLEVKETVAQDIETDIKQGNVQNALDKLDQFGDPEITTTLVSLMGEIQTNNGKLSEVHPTLFNTNYRTDADRTLETG
jgi:hypothetical protein